MPLSNLQIGTIAQYDVAKLVVIGSDGRLELSWPMTDDERRDAEVHIRGHFAETLAVQVKTVTHLQRPRGRVTAQLQIPFAVRKEHLITDPRLWYHLSCFSLATAGFVDPQYFANSIKVHRSAVPRLRNGVWRFSFQANLAEDSRDIWVPDRVHGIEVGQRILQILDDQAQLPRAQRPTEAFRLPPGAALVRRKS